MNAKERVLRTLEFQKPDRVPRQLWTLPWAHMHYQADIDRILRDFPEDFATAPAFYRDPPRVTGDPTMPGDFTDEWGCTFHNIHEGIIGEIKEPLIGGEEYEDLDKLVPPVGELSLDIDQVNAWCREHRDSFIVPGYCARPFERMQFLRGTEQFFYDLALRPDGLYEALNRVHSHQVKVLELWAKTDVDALFYMDDWGAQISLLIKPETWVELFKPMYKDYIDIAHAAGKKIFMHSDGFTLAIIPHLIELGLDAMNTQIFCIGLDKLEQFKGQITFWGEMDRQHLLAGEATPADVEAAVHRVKDALWQDGGCIAQCEFGPGGKPENVYAVYDTWNSIQV